MKVIGFISLFVLVGCGGPPEPTFYTSQGIGILYDDDANLNKFGDAPDRHDIYDFAFDIILDNASKITKIKADILLDKLLDFGLYVRVTTKDLEVGDNYDVTGFFRQEPGYIIYENLNRGDAKTIAHEMGHVFQYILSDYEELDYEHKNKDYFYAEGSLEGLSKPLIFEYCTDGVYMEFP